MIILSHVNKLLNSNTYLFYNDLCEGVWLIDPGDVEPIFEWLDNTGSFIKGILITHAHFDHIYGIIPLLSLFPDLLVYCSQKAQVGMASSRINCSYYTESPFEIANNKTICCVTDNDAIYLWNGMSAIALFTPGHNNDCMSFAIGENIFTGDAFIPGIKAFSMKFKGGNEQEATNSLNRIFSISSVNTIFYPGHGKIYTASEAKSVVFFVPREYQKGFVK